MTALDVFLKTIPDHIHVLSGQQKTPSYLNLSFSEEDFFELLKTIPEEQMVFRFLEKTPKNKLFVHLTFLRERITLQITIEVINNSKNFGAKLCEFFPPAVAHLAEF